MMFHKVEKNCLASMSVTVSLIISYEHIEIMKRNVGEQRGQRGTSFRWQDSASLHFFLSRTLIRPCPLERHR